MTHCRFAEVSHKHTRGALHLLTQALWLTVVDIKCFRTDICLVPPATLHAIVGLTAHPGGAQEGPGPAGEQEASDVRDRVDELPGTESTPVRVFLQGKAAHAHVRLNEVCDVHWSLE